MSTKKQAYVDTFMQTLAGGFELNERLTKIFSNVLQRQLEEDDNGNITPKGNFETLAKVFTFVATPSGDRPSSPFAYNAGLLQAAQDAAIDAADGYAQTISLDIGTITDREVVNAGQGNFIFTDDASEETFVDISNFSEGDQIRISNLPNGAEYSFVNAGTDIDITYNYNDAGTMNHIKLLGVGSDNPFSDEAGFEAAIGFNAISYA